MARLSKGVAFLLAALLLISSCSLEDFMRGMAPNVMGGLGGDEIVSGIEDLVDSGFTSEDPDSDPYKELVNLVVQASKNPDTEKKLVDTLSQDATEDSKTKMQPILEDIESEIVTETGSASIEDFLTQAETSLKEDNSDSSLPDAVQEQALNAIAAAKNIVGDIRNPSAEGTTTKGDIAIINSALSIVKTVMNEMDNTGDDGLSEEQISSLISTANEALKMFNTIKSATAFKDINLNVVLDSFLSEMNSPDGEQNSDSNEGGETV